MFVGAGYAGLEGIAELQDYMADMLDRYPRSRLAGTRWMLVEARERDDAGDPARAWPSSPRASCARRGMEIRTGTTLERMDERSATLSTGEAIPTRLVCWTAGVNPPGVVHAAGAAARRAGAASRWTRRCG